jgi:hypothetical protein
MGDPPRAAAGAPGLTVWIAVGVIVGVILCAAALFSGYAEKKVEKDKADFISSMVATIGGIPPPGSRTKPVVVVVGSSLIRAALLMDGGPLNKMPAGTQLIVFSVDRLQPEYFDGLVPALHRSRPDLLLIEAALLHATPFQAGRRDRVEHLLRALRWWKRSTAAPVCEGLTLRKSVKASDLGRMYQDVFSSFTLDRLADLEDFRSDGIAVAVLDMPHARELEAAAPSIVNWQTKMSAQLSAAGFDVWRAPGPWLADEFCDMAHLNAEGAQAFAAWFGPRLAEAVHVSP